MPCQCGTTATAAEDSQTTGIGCGCAGEPAEGSETTGMGCGCAGEPAEAPSNREIKLERLVMELDKRVRKLEATG